MNEPSRRQDPLALAVIGGAIALVAAIGLFLVFSIRSQPEGPATASFPQQVRDAARKLASELRKELEPAPPAKPQPRPQAQTQTRPQPQATPQAAPQAKAVEPQRGRIVLQAGRSWRYSVKVEPEAWKDIMLTYRTVQEGKALGVQTDFRHAGGQSAFNLGVFAPNHPSHANTRFPGFFMYAAYLELPLQVGQKVGFGWHWQGKSPGSMKRFQGVVTAMEDVQLAGGALPAARIEGTLTYHEDGQFRGGARETFWYAPKVGQVVRILREGRVPDENLNRISADLVEYR
ncbi:MAG: hypothetical protein ACT4P9_17595 [Betaproteobacteria bacterium]